MNTNKKLCLAIALAALAPCAGAADVQLARPQMVLQQTVSGMPQGASQEVRVMTAHLKPGDQTPFHSHRFPVTVYIQEGSFTLEMEGREPMVLKAGQAYVEPPNIRMTGYNRSATEALRVMIFYVSDPETPFLDPAR